MMLESRVVRCVHCDEDVAKHLNLPKTVLEWNPICRRIRGRPRKRWIEDVEEDIQRMGIRGWRKLRKEK
jgi:hypothetical protein